MRNMPQLRRKGARICAREYLKRFVSKALTINHKPLTMGWRVNEGTVVGFEGSV